MVYDLQKAELQQAAMPAEYIPTRRLTKAQAAKHLGMSVRTLDSRISSGEVIRHYSEKGKPYFLLGELDGLRMPGVGAAREGKVRGYNKRQVQ